MNAQSADHDAHDDGIQHIVDDNGNEPQELKNEIPEQEPKKPTEPLGHVSGADNLRKIHDFVTQAKNAGQSKWGDGDNGYAQPKSHTDRASR